MKLIIPFESEKEVTIPVPCFWKKEEKNELTFTALLDDETFVRVFRKDDHIAIINGLPEDNESSIRRAFMEHDLMTEEEFFQEFSDAFESIRLHPKEVTTANCYSENH